MSYIGCMGYMGSGNVRGLRKLFWIVVQTNTDSEGPESGIAPCCLGSLSGKRIRGVEKHGSE